MLQFHICHAFLILLRDFWKSLKSIPYYCLPNPSAETKSFQYAFLVVVYVSGSTPGVWPMMLQSVKHGDSSLPSSPSTNPLQ